MIDNTIYNSAVHSTAYYRLPGIGCLLVKGEDRLDFLQRQSTNDLRLLKPGSALLTVLTNPSARILDVLTLLSTDGADSTGSETLIALPSPGLASQTLEFLQSCIFFMDKITIEDHSDQYEQLEIVGPSAEDLMGSLGLKRIPSEGELFPTSFAGQEMFIIGGFSGLYLGCRILVPGVICSELEGALNDAGAKSLDAPAYQSLRVESGVPSASSELTGEYTPLEVGLVGAVSDSRGCYTGQEVIARQITYNKVNKSLIGLRIEHSVASGSRVLAEKKPVGTITSVAESPRFGWIGLAVVKRPHNEKNRELFVEGGDSGGKGRTQISATVSDLPFQ